MGFADFLSGLIGLTPSNRAAEGINIARGNQAQQLQDEYAAAMADPNSGVGLSPAMQQMQENELAQSVRSRMSDAGAGQSGAANSAVTKSIVDYRIQQMAQRQRYLDSLRTGMLTASTPQPVANTAPQNMVSGFAGRAGQSFASDLFGPSDEERNQRGGWDVRPSGAPAVYPSQGTNATGQSPNDPNQYRDAPGV